MRPWRTLATVGIIKLKSPRNIEYGCVGVLHWFVCRLDRYDRIDEFRHPSPTENDEIASLTFEKKTSQEYDLVLCVDGVFVLLRLVFLFAKTR